MSKEYNIKPKLRFSEFSKTMDWGLKELGELSDVIKGVQLNKIELIPTGNYPCLNGGIFPSGYTNKFNTEENTITISEGGNSCGYVNFMITKFWLGGHCYKLIPLNKVDNLFLFHLLKFNEGRIMRLRVGSGLPNIQQKALRSIQLQFTYNKQEQQKIAACLSSLDDLITAENKKLETLKAHKNGLLQNLFPADGETVPKLRFKEFEESGEWMKIKLGDVCKFIRGPFGGALKKEIFIREGYAVYEQSHAIYNDFSSFRYFISKQKFDELKRFAVHPNDIIMSCSGTMGKFSIIPENSKQGVINQALLKLTTKNEYEVNFIKTILELPLYQNKLLSQSAGGAIKNVVEVAQIKEIELLLPGLKEQHRISSLINAINNQINIQDKKIGTLKLHKKGLLQGLFPDTTEITA